MKLSELQQALRAADPAAVLVAPRVLDRVIQQVSKLPSFVWQIPHRRCFVVDRHILFRHVEQDDLDLEPEQLLPPTVILLARPPAEKLNEESRDENLLKYWRRLFHANVHVALAQKHAQGKLTAADIQNRIAAIGIVEIEEIRTVLTQEYYLFPRADQRELYCEFAAVYLELRHFAPNLLPFYFPGIRDLDHVDQLLATDVDSDAMFERTRLTGAPMPQVRTDKQSDESYDFFRKLVRSAEREAAKGNTVRAAILRTRAARVAPADLAAETRELAGADLTQLTQRLQNALKLSDQTRDEWLKVLPALLDKADQGSRPIEATLLFDLQRICLDHERDIYALDLVEWLLSAGKRPIKRPLPSQRLVRINRHIRAASQRLTAARLSDDDRLRCTNLLQDSLRRSSEELEARFRPVLTDALYDVGLQPSNPPEYAAFSKMVEELLDRIAEYGFLTFSDLRDALSRNQLKLPDLGDPQEFIRGDPLLRLDRRLAAMLDGVYRPSEIYMRWLERATAINFGTDTGRTITRYFSLPFGSAFIIQEGASLVFEKLGLPTLPSIVHYLLMIALGFFLLGLLHVESMRRRLLDHVHAVGRGLYKVVVEWPREIIPFETLTAVWRSWAFQLFYWYVLKPLVACLFIWLWVPEAFETPIGAVCVFATCGFLINSRIGQAVAEAVPQALASFYELLRSGLIPGMFQIIVSAFKHTIDMVEYVLFTVDEWLRFRGGDSRLSLIARTFLGILWFPISYIARFYMVVLIEPGINPIKLPVSSVAAKFIYPLSGILTPLLLGYLAPVVGGVGAKLIVVPTIFFLPDVFGFLFWETKENWKLYRANRSPTLRPVSIGSHGETMVQLLRPGFHSGTVPRLFTRLRKAVREAVQTGNWRTARSYKHSLEEIEQSVRDFVDRETLTLLRRSRSWHGQPVELGRVVLACNRITLELVNSLDRYNPVWIEFDDRFGWLIAHVGQRGWLDSLPPQAHEAFAAALASLYKLAGADLVLEQIRANLPPPATGFEIVGQCLEVWSGENREQLIRYNLREPTTALPPINASDQIDPQWPTIEARSVIFALAPLYWDTWVDSWLKDNEGQQHAPFLESNVVVLANGAVGDNHKAETMSVATTGNSSVGVEASRDELPAK